MPKPSAIAKLALILLFLGTPAFAQSHSLEENLIGSWEQLVGTPVSPFFNNGLVFEEGGNWNFRVPIVGSLLYRVVREDSLAGSAGSQDILELSSRVGFFGHRLTLEIVCLDRDILVLRESNPRNDCPSKLQIFSRRASLDEDRTPDLQFP